MNIEQLKIEAQKHEFPQDEIDKVEQGRLSFISKFPLDSIKDLSIDQYVQGTDDNSFCYWLEFEKTCFGIGGGTAHKFGLYKAKDSNYYTGSSRKTKSLTGEELDAFFTKIKEGIVLALQYTERDEIEKIRDIDIPIWNMVLQKILCIYFPEKFIAIGSQDVLLACARDIQLQNIELVSDNSIQINYECKKTLSSLPEYKDWNYKKLGTFVYQSYKKEVDCNYYIIGSKYGGDSDHDIFPQQLEQSVIAVGFAPHLDLTDYYLKTPTEIKNYLIEQGEPKNSYNALTKFLTIKVGDFVAIKASGSPKDSKGFLSIVAIAEVVEKDGAIYRYDPNGLGHLINVKFIKAPVYKEFELGGYGSTIHKLSKPDHIDLIFKSEYPDIQTNQDNLFEKTTRYWLYTPESKAKYWEEFYSEGIMAIGWDELGDLKQYDSKEDIRRKLLKLEGKDSEDDSSPSKKNDVRANYEFYNKMKIGDIVIVKKGTSTLLGYGVVSSDYYFDDSRSTYRNCRKVDWELKGEWTVDFKLVLKTLTDVTKYATEDKRYNTYYERLLGIMGGDASSQPDTNPDTTGGNEMNFPLNTILYGPPGTGKTYELLKKWIPKYTSEKRSAKEKYDEAIREFVANATWWETIVFVMADIDKNSIKVKEIFDHPVLQMKVSLSNSKSIRATIWGTLQAHTIDDSKTVRYTQKQSPQIFDKNEDSTWHFIDEWKDIAPEIAETIDEIKNSKDTPVQVIKRYEFVTFHQSYGYEEFIEGLRPETTEDGQIKYEVKPGVFQRICNKAKLDPENRYAIFIDEINRGNISKIFGELITLIEDDKRVRYDKEGKVISGDTGLELTLPYSGNKFGVPVNIDIIGTMNTADRSIALLDIALRRRFEFKELMPDAIAINGADGNGSIEGGAINLRELLIALNTRICLLAGRELQLGHAFFCNVKTFADLNSCFANKVIPLLQEYFYGNWERIQLVLGDDPEQLTSKQKSHKETYCFILSETLDEIDVLGFDHDDHDDRQMFSVNPNLFSGTLDMNAYTKIYQAKNATEANS